MHHHTICLPYPWRHVSMAFTDVDELSKKWLELRYNWSREQQLHSVGFQSIFDTNSLRCPWFWFSYEVRYIVTTASFMVTITKCIYYSYGLCFHLHSSSSQIATGSSSCCSLMSLGTSSVTTPHSNSTPSAPLSSFKKQSVLSGILNILEHTPAG